MAIESVIDLIGNTPMMRLRRMEESGGAEILAKLEFFNPGGSVKDRIAWYMTEVAAQEGTLKKGGTIVEATSGNTGIGLALVAAAKGYRLILIMPETMSIERQSILKAYGAKLILTPGIDGMKGAVEKLQEIMAKNPSYYTPSQFDNSANPQVHRITTGPEILSQTGCRIDAFVAGVGTGGTITGAGEVIKEALPNTLVVGVEPEGSPVLSGGEAGPHKIQGIGAGFVPPVLNKNIMDRIIRVTDEDAYLTSVALARKEGLLAGISAGAAVFAAQRVARELGPDKRVVTVLPDTGERYLSMAPYFNLSLRKKYNDIETRVQE